jgi:hypothetical protein
LACLVLQIQALASFFVQSAKRQSLKSTTSHDRSVEIFEKILGAEHPETLDARDILTTPSAPPTAKAVEPAVAAPTLGPAADVGWAVEPATVAEICKQAEAGSDMSPGEPIPQQETVSTTQPDSAALVSESS